MIFVLLAPIAYSEQPTTVYGKVVDDEGNPVPGELITIEWQDEFGNHSINTMTVTYEQAIALGNIDLIGSYILNRREIMAPIGTEIMIRTQPRVSFRKIYATPGSIVEVNELTIPGLYVGPIEQYIQEEKKEPSQFFPKLWILLKKAFLPLVLIVALYFMWKSFLKFYRRKRNIRSYVKSQLSNEVSSLMSKRVKNLMTKTPIITQKDSGILEALETMITKGVNSIIVMSGKNPIGIISECDFLKKVYTRDKIEPIKVTEIMSSPLKTITPDYTLGQCIDFAIKNNIRRVPVVKGKSLEGIITVSDILREMERFFSRVVVEASNAPVASDIMAKDIPEINDDARISDVLSYMIWKKTNFYLVRDRNSERMLTSSDALSEFYKSLNEMYKMKLKQITIQPLVFVSMHTSVFEVLTVMKNNDFRKIPVADSSKVVGIISQLALLRAFYNFTNLLKKTK